MADFVFFISGVDYTSFRFMRMVINADTMKKAVTETVLLLLVIVRYDIVGKDN